MNVPESKRWLEYARNDLNAAATLLKESTPFLRQVCFLSQQAAEKALKAILVYLEIEFPFTHDLDYLRNLISEGRRIKSEHPDLAELTVWAVEARYPGDLPEISVNDAHKAYLKAEAVYLSAENEINRGI